MASHDTTTLPPPAQPLAPPDSRVAQFGFAPATQTTVVTTTTTTTTSFPPFVFKGPRNLRERNPVMYPLAASSTPESVKRLKLNIGGKIATFEENENASAFLRDYHDQQDVLQAHNGRVQNIEQTNQPATPLSPRGTHRSNPIFGRPLHHELVHPSPDTISASDAAELRSLDRRNRFTLDRLRYRSNKKHPLSQHESNEATASETESLETETQTSEDDSPMISHAPQFGSPRRSPRLLNTPADDQRPKSRGGTSGHAQGAGGSATPPPIDGDAHCFKAPSSHVERTLRPSPPATVNTSPLNDGSLPSPSLSPITAGAQLHQPFGTMNSFTSSVSEEKARRTTSREASKQTLQIDTLLQSETEDRTTASFNDIPFVVDTFDALPDNLKSYVIFQLLRRCSKETLRFTVESIDPGLRCDFISRLPLELSLNILQYLDFQSMCNAAQVSRKWRQTVDSDERRWHDLLREDGFTVPVAEIKQAIQQGWGWQCPTSVAECEMDLSGDSAAPSITSDNSLVLSGALKKPTIDSVSRWKLTGLNLSSKRKRKGQNGSTSSKRQRRHGGTSHANSSPSWIQSLDRAPGPIAYANAAAAALPDPGIGLPSLRNLHLFKSIYRRHVLIKKAWMDPSTKPLHLAFRAHQRHVVTCLQFDSDRILTGSDDSNIDIYDTKSGAALKRLVGHEGGVWALEYYNGLLVSGSTDRSVRIWDMETGKNLHTFLGHTSTVRCLQIVRPSKIGETADGKPIMMPKVPLIITGSRDSSCRVWKLPELGDESTTHSEFDDNCPYFVRALTGHINSVRAIAAHGDTLVSGSYDSTVRVWKISTGETVHRLTGHTAKVYSVVLDHKRKRCISGSMDNLVKMWNLETGSCIITLEGHTSLVGLLDLRDDVLVSAAADATLRIWDPASGACKHVLDAHTGAITCFAHDGEKVISGSDKTLKMWNTKSGEFVRDLLTDLSGVWQIKFDERRCVAAVQRENWTYIEVLDFGAARDGWEESQRGVRTIVNTDGEPSGEEEAYPATDTDANVAPEV